MNTDDPIKDLLDASYKHIPIPEGLEARLAATVDATAHRPRRIGLRVLTYAAAASVAIAITLGLWQPFRQTQPVLLADTYSVDQVDEAYLEAERVLRYVSQKMNDGLNQAHKTTQESVALPLSVVNSLTKKQAL